MARRVVRPALVSGLLAVGVVLAAAAPAGAQSRDATALMRKQMAAAEARNIG